MTKSFLYFAYGSNLLTKRIHLNNPSAVRIGIGKIKDFRIDFFNYESKRWKGAPATITLHKGFCVWGAIWQLDIDDLASLDRQENVQENIYRRFETTVEMPSGVLKKCYVYEHPHAPKYLKINKLPFERQPSLIYLNTIIKGAEESGLPEEYVRVLRKTVHNGYDGDVHHDLS